MFALGTIGGPEVLLVLLGWLIPTIFSLYLISRYQRGWLFFAWLLVIIFIPFLGPIACIMRHYLGREATTVEVD